MRKPMVTRTFKGMELNVMGVDTKLGEVSNKTVVIPRAIKDPNKLLKAVKDGFETETYKVVQIVDTKEVETMYGMTEQDFISHAQILDPETRKAIEEPEAETEAEVETEN